MLLPCQVSLCLSALVCLPAACGEGVNATPWLMRALLDLRLSRRARMGAWARAGWITHRRLHAGCFDDGPPGNGHFGDLGEASDLSEPQRRPTVVRSDASGTP